MRKTLDTTVEHRRGAAGGVNLVAHVYEALDERNADGLGDERHGARGARSDTFFVGVPAHICAVGLYLTPLGNP